eukprot:957346-Rhodomonas_salina.2
MAQSGMHDRMRERGIEEEWRMEGGGGWRGVGEATLALSCSATSLSIDFMSSFDCSFCILVREHRQPRSD